MLRTTAQLEPKYDCNSITLLMPSSSTGSTNDNLTNLDHTNASAVTILPETREKTADSCM